MLPSSCREQQATITTRMIGCMVGERWIERGEGEGTRKEGVILVGDGEKDEKNEPC